MVDEQTVKARNALWVGLDDFFEDTVLWTSICFVKSVVLMDTILQSMDL